MPRFSHSPSELVLASLEQLRVTVVHTGTGGGEFHAPARGLYDSLGFIRYPTADYDRAI